VFIGGIISYLNIGKLEDAEIPLKTAMVITVYPGASAHEVELEVTDVLEKAIQKLENIDEIKSVSQPGVSFITVNIQQTVKTGDLPQLWDHLRRKVNDAKGSLPSEAYEPIVNDDFADTYGMLYAVTAEGYSTKELRRYTEYIERELLALKGVRRSQIFGNETETIDVSFSPERLASLNINPMYIAMAMQNQSQIVNPGTISVGRESVRIGVGNKITSMNEIENLLIQVPGGGNFRLGDIASIKRSTMDPKREALYFNGKKGLTLGLSNESGINVVELGENITKKLIEIKNHLPAGIEINDVYLQSERVSVAVKDFMWNLVMSVGIVILVLLFAMGYRSGLLISSGLVFTILGTLIVMLAIGLPLHRVSLSAIILAMGMLVDNAIVVADGILVDLKKGVDRNTAFVATAKRTAWPLLGATIVAILAFLPLRLAPNMAGEFLSDLFSVLVISLLLSWIFAMVQTPFMAKLFYRKERPKGEKADSFDQGIYLWFRKSVRWSLRHKMAFFISSIFIVIISFWAFKFVKIDFMPGIEYDQCVVEYNLPNGSEIEAVEDDLLEIQTYIRKEIEGITFVTTSIGRPPARYTLMRYMPTGGTYYGELLIEAESIERTNEIIPEIEAYIKKNYPDAQFRVHKYGAAFSDYDLEIQFSGPDPKILRQLSAQAEGIFKNEPKIENVTNNWRNQSKKLSPKYAVNRAQKLGLSRNDMGNSILIATNGMPIGAFYEGETKMPIILKTNNDVANNIESLLSIPVWGQRSQYSVPLNQIVDTVVLGWENMSVTRIDGQRAIRAQGDAIEGISAATGYALVKDAIAKIDIPYGYSMKWEGAVSGQEEANAALFKFLPLALGLMIIIIIGLFNNFKQPAIIFTLLPFSLVGISLGFNLTGLPFNFVAIIGTLGLMGMMIKNAIVLLDEINIGLRAGKTQVQAIIDSAVSRLRPVMMASLTTILGMLPLIADPMFQSMSIAIMFGLFAGALITLIVVPVMYAIFYKVDISELKPLIKKSI
jgi:multidrug efflux pump subunit AcrB